MTVVGERLRTGAPAGMRSWAVFVEALGGVRPFGHILETIKTGRSGRDIEFGLDLFEFIAQNPEAAAIFDAAMSPNAEYGKLLNAAGLTLGNVQPVASPYGVIEGLSV